MTPLHSALLFALLVTFVSLSEGRVTYYKFHRNPCYDNPCHEGAQCIMWAQTAYKCVCPEGSFGDHCEYANMVARTEMVDIVKSYECAQSCEMYNQRGQMSCTSARVTNGTKCLLSLEPKVVHSQSGMVKTCSNTDVAYGQSVTDGWWSSSSYHSSCPPWHARLAMTSGCAGWRVADNNFYNQHLTLHFGKDIIAYRAVFKPRYDTNEWMKVVKIQYHSGISGQWRYMTDETGWEMRHAIFNTTSMSTAERQSITKEIVFDYPIVMNYFRVWTKEYHVFPSARYEVYGCDYLLY